MLFEEYKKTFEEILSLTIEIEQLCVAKKIDEIKEPFTKRDELFKKLSVPDDIPDDDDKVNYVLNLREQIQAKNENIIRCFKVFQNEIKKELLNLKGEDKLIEAYKIPITSNISKIFDSLE